MDMFAHYEIGQLKEIAALLEEILKVLKELKEVRKNDHQQE